MQTNVPCRHDPRAAGMHPVVKGPIPHRPQITSRTSRSQPTRERRHGVKWPCRSSIRDKRIDMPVAPSSEEEVRAMGSGAIGTLQFTWPARSMPLIVRAFAVRRAVSLRVEGAPGSAVMRSARDAAGSAHPGRIHCLPDALRRRRLSGFRSMAKRTRSFVCEPRRIVYRCPTRSVPTANTTTMQWSRPLRAIHLLLAIAVTAQLFVGSFMRSPHPGRPDTFGFLSHEVIGAGILVLVVLHWLWSLTHPAEGIGHLFPWTRAGMRRVSAELWQGVRYRRLPPGGPEDFGLTGFVHGLGLLAVSATVVIGAMFFALRATGASQTTLGVVEDVHDTFAVVVWIYWGGHLAATVAHALLHQPVSKRMLSLRS